jgi:hypothetical protein
MVMVIDKQKHQLEQHAKCIGWQQGGGPAAHTAMLNNN